MNYTTKKDARAKVGDIVRIDGFEPDSNGSLPRTEMTLVGKTGRVQFIDDSGAIHGTWGGISLLPCDKYHVVEEA